MECPECQLENKKGAKLCNECGHKFELICPECGEGNRIGSKFCNDCGCEITAAKETTDKTPDEEIPSPAPPDDDVCLDSDTIVGERKHVTVLFSDLTGYTSMSEKLDPEEVKELTTQIFDEISNVVGNYDGFIEKFAGDAVMAMFGATTSHEDDPIIAIKVARKIHELVDAISPEVENRIGQSISMHTGINTGLVVTGEVNMERGTHGVAGDTINVASRLSNFAKAGEVLVDIDTWRQAEGHFTFECLGPTIVKGKIEPVQVYKVLSPKKKPSKLHRLSGLKADLIGRNVEMEELRKAVANLRKDKGSIFSICGSAGTGKSRLVGDFKATLNLKEIQWIEGHAYPYGQFIPYFPLIDLLNRVFQIEEGDPSERIRERIESGIENIVGTKEDMAPYIGSLYALSYPEADDASPDFWKSRLGEVTLTLISALAKKSPTIYLLEDLHWADPSFVELLRNAILKIKQPAIVLCVYRPEFTLLKNRQSQALSKIHHGIRLHDLSPSDAQEMLRSLLNSETIPSDLTRLVQDKAEGNPFYLEELINSLIESETLSQINGLWRITKRISEADISSTIHGVISGRLDRLEKDTKRILQEASVLGRTFLYEILKRITKLNQSIDRCLKDLEQLDLIRTKSLLPELEYIFKHALTQEVVYNGLLKKERRKIHERIGLVIERLFQDRLPEYYETLAYHFKQGQSVLKAVDYLILSGEKSLKRYAIEESHKCYKDAFVLLTQVSGKTTEETKLLIDLINRWGMVFHHRGDFKGMEELFRSHEEIAASLKDNKRLGEYYMWLGQALHLRLKEKESYRYLTMAFKLGKKANDMRVIGWASAYLPSVCGFLGYLDEGLYFESKAIEISKTLDSEHFLYIQAMASIGYANWSRGEKNKTFEIGKALLEFGKIKKNVRGLAIGNLNVGHSYLISGDYHLAIKSYKNAINISADPFHSKLSETMLGICYLMNGQLLHANAVFPEILNFSQKFGTESMGTPVKMFLGAVFISLGQMVRGYRMIKTARQYFYENDLIYFQALSEYILGKLYLQIVEGSTRLSLLTMTKNIIFLIKQVPFSYKKGKLHFIKAIELGNEIGAKSVVGQAYFDLGVLHKAKNRSAPARKCLQEAIRIFKQSEAGSFLNRAEKELISIQ